MTTQQHTQSRGALIWNLFQWCKRRQEAKREGNLFSVEYCQEWIDDCRARVLRLDAMRREVTSGPVISCQCSEEGAR
jgi:hypothetical protein